MYHLHTLLKNTEAAACFVDIGGVVDNHFLIFLFMFFFINNPVFLECRLNSSFIFELNIFY